MPKCDYGCNRDAQYVNYGVPFDLFACAKHRHRWGTAARPIFDYLDGGDGE